MKVADVLYEVLMRNAPYQAREDLLAAVREAVAGGRGTEAGAAAASLVTLIHFKRGKD